LLETLRRLEKAKSANGVIEISEGYLRNLWNRSNLKFGLTNGVSDQLFEWNWCFFPTPHGYAAVLAKTLQTQNYLGKADATHIRKSIEEDGGYAALEASLEEHYNRSWSQYEHDER